MPMRFLTDLKPTDAIGPAAEDVDTNAGKAFCLGPAPNTPRNFQSSNKVPKESRRSKL